MELNKFFQSKGFKLSVLIICGLIIVLAAFWAGLFIGFRQARFSFAWGENYHRNFGGPGQMMPPDLNARNFIPPHGVFGKVIKIDGSTLVIKGSDGMEKLVIVNENTAIQEFRDQVQLNDLKVDDEIVVIGEPNDSGQIEAKLIRLLPAPPALEDKLNNYLPLRHNFRRPS